MKYNLALGVALSLFATLFYSLLTALIKATAIHLPPLPVIIFIQSLVSLLFILPVMFKHGANEARKLMTTQKIRLHLLRTVFSLCISYFLFYAVTFIPLVNGMLLSNTAPLIVPFIAYLFLSQKINHRLWAPLIIGYVGVVLVLQPDASIFNPASLLALGAGVAQASSIMIIRRLSATEATETTTFYFFLLSTLISGVISIHFWTPVSTQMLLIMVTIGILYFTCQYALTSAARYINAQLLSSLFYASILYSAVISLFVWHTLPTLFTLLGMIMIIIGGIICIRIEHKSHQRATHLSQGKLDYAKET